MFKIADKNLSIKDVIDFIDDDERWFHHTKYYHYSTIDSLDKMLESQKIRMSKLWNEKSANDTTESKWYVENGVDLFSFCLSTGTSESLPLWYLYSGVDGNGARIEFKKKAIRYLKDEGKVYLCELESDGKTAKNRSLIDKNDYTISVYDILYLGKDTTKDCYRIKYNGQVRNNITLDEFNWIKKIYSKSYKGLIWFYEKETRLEIKIKNKNLLTKFSNYAIELDISEVLDDISICIGPEISKEERCEYIKSYKNIKSFALSKIKASDYAGEIKMHIKQKTCKNCNKENNKN